MPRVDEGGSRSAPFRSCGHPRRTCLATAPVSGGHARLGATAGARRPTGAVPAGPSGRLPRTPSPTSGHGLDAARAATSGSADEVDIVAREPRHPRGRGGGALTPGEWLRLGARVAGRAQGGPAVPCRDRPATGRAPVRWSAARMRRWRVDLLAMRRAGPGWVVGRTCVGWRRRRRAGTGRAGPRPSVLDSRGPLAGLTSAALAAYHTRVPLPAGVPCGHRVAGPRTTRHAEAEPHRRSTPHAVRLDAPAARGRCPLRAPDPPLEPQDEALHLRRAQRDPHHRPGPDGQAAWTPRSPSSPRRPRGDTCSSWAPRSRPRSPSPRKPPRRRCPTSTSAGWAACSPTS